VTDDTFTCALCHETFDKAWSDEEALAESHDLWPQEHIDGVDMDVVCDDCHHGVLAWVQDANTG